MTGHPRVRTTYQNNILEYVLVALRRWIGYFPTGAVARSEAAGPPTSD
jgi:hypothetical protein